MDAFEVSASCVAAFMGEAAGHVSHWLHAHESCCCHSRGGSLTQLPTQLIDGETTQANKAMSCIGLAWAAEYVASR